MNEPFVEVHKFTHRKFDAPSEDNAHATGIDLRGAVMTPDRSGRRGRRGQAASSKQTGANVD